MTDENQSENADSAKKPARNANVEKWGAQVMAEGFCLIPSLLLRAQPRLHLSPTQLAVLLQIIDHWWEADRKPYPGKKELSDRLGISQRQVQRYLTELEEEGLLRRVERYGDHGGRLSNLYDLQGLVDKLTEIAPDFRKIRDEGRKDRKAASKPGWRPRKKAAPVQDSSG